MKKFLLMSVALAFVIAIFMLLSETDRLQEGEIAQSGSIEISNSLSYKHDVLYPEKFSASPRVKIKLTSGSGHIEIIEQRTDGFSFKSSNLGYSVAEGAHVEWIASGPMVK